MKEMGELISEATDLKYFGLKKSGSNVFIGENSLIMVAPGNTRKRLIFCAAVNRSQTLAMSFQFQGGKKDS